CLEAASRCASLSTAPARVTTPSLACTVSCLPERPESWLNLLWISLEICASSGFLAQPTPRLRMTANTNKGRDVEILFINSTPDFAQVWASQTRRLLFTV